MTIRMRGRAFVVGDWIHERDILGPAAAREPSLKDVLAAGDGLVARLGGAPHRAPERRDLLIAGRGFAHGTRTDHAALVVAAQGFGAVLADSVDWRFRQSAYRFGLPVLAVQGVKQRVKPDQELIVGIDVGTVEMIPAGRVLVADPPTPGQIQIITQAPGLAAMGVKTSQPTDPDVLEVPARPAARVDAS